MTEAESAAFAGCEAQSAEQPADGNPQRCRGREAPSTTRELSGFASGKIRCSDLLCVFSKFYAFRLIMIAAE